MGPIGRVLAALVLTALGGLWSSPAEAAFALRIEDPTTLQGVVITDGGTGDANATEGAITFVGSLGSGFVVNVTTGLSKPVIGGVNNFAELDLNSVNVQTTGAGTLRVTLVDSGYAGGPDGLNSMVMSVGGTLTAPTGSTVAFTGGVSPSDAVPALGPNSYPLGALPAIGAFPADSVMCSVDPTFVASSFSGACGVEFFRTGSYSLFAQALITFTGAGVVSFDQNLQVVPEPASLLLLGTGLLGAATAARRRRSTRHG